MRILLIEDDHPLANAMLKLLHAEGMTTDWLDDGNKALQALIHEHFDAAILDLNLPGIDGMSVLRQARKQKVATPVIILTARGDLADRLNGLDAGADDYLAKPFAMTELVARIRAISRRSVGLASELLQVGPLSLDAGQQKITLDTQSLILSRTELLILECLMRRAGQVVTRRRLEEQLYGWEQGVESNVLEVHIHNLRKKIGKQAIRTLRGVGYLLDEAALAQQQGGAA